MLYYYYRTNLPGIYLVQQFLSKVNQYMYAYLYPDKSSCSMSLMVFIATEATIYLPLLANFFLL